MGSAHAQASGRSIRLYFAVIWFFYLVLKPIYLFPLGMPQISDIVLVFAIVPAAIIMFLESKQSLSLVVVVGALFAAMTVVINLVNYAFYPDLMLVLSSLYYPYNFLIFLFAVFLLKRDYDFIVRLTVAGIIISIIIQFVSSEFFPDFDDGNRLTGGFKNPNQLAYWALLSSSILVFLRRDRKLGAVEILAIVLAGYIQTLALSKAGIISFGIFLLVLALAPQFPNMARIFAIFAVLLGGCYLLFAKDTVGVAESDMGAYQRVVHRMDTLGYEADDSLEGRGYNRIAEWPEYLFVGAGEGAFERFRTAGSPGELHSGLATILFSYGIVGFFLFGSFLFLIFYRQPWYCIAFLLVTLMYGMTSQTFRFSHSWVFFGVAYGTYIAKKEEEASGAGALPECLLPQQV